MEDVQAGALRWEQGLGRWDLGLHRQGWRGQAGSRWALTSEHAGLVSRYLSGLAEVTLVTNEHDDDRGLGVVVELLQPALHHGIGLVLG